MEKIGNEADFMYNWIREKSGNGIVETNNSGSSDNNPNATYSTHSIEQDYCSKHHIRLNNDGLCNVCMELNNK